MASLSLAPGARAVTPRRPRRWLWPALVVLAGAAGTGAWQRHSSAPNDSAAPRSAIAQPPARENRPASFSASGYVSADVISRVGVRVVGRLAEVRVVEGDHVRRGQLLARLDLRSEAASRRSALAKGAAAQARAAQARALLEQDNQELARQRQLTAGGAAARAVVETVELRARADEEAARAAEAEAEAAAAEIERSSAELLARDVIAPMDGVVVGRPLAIGEIVGLPGSEPILELADFDHLNVEVDVPEAKLDVVAPGTACEVALDAHPGRRYRGRVAAIGARVNRAKATVVVKVRFDDAVEGVLPDMAAQVAFVATQDHPPKPDRH